MTRSSVNFIVDAIIALLFLCVICVASIVHFIFPAPSHADGWTLWGMAFDTWMLVEIITICAFAVAVLVHLIFHWTWVCGFVTNRIANRTGLRIRTSPSAKTLYGVTTLIVVLTILGIVYTMADFAIVQAR